MLLYAYGLNFIIPLLVVFFEQRNYNVVCGGMWYGLYDIERSKRKMGCIPTMDKLLCAAGRIPGAVKMATIWLVPKDAKKPVDGQTKQGKELKNAEDTLRRR